MLKLISLFKRYKPTKFFFCGVILFVLGGTNFANATTYTSTTSGYWNIGSTWDNGIPINSSSNTVIISAGTTVTLYTNTNFIGTIEIKAGGILNLGNYTLKTPAGLTLYCGALTGSSITGAGILTLGGNVTVNDANTGTAGATISCPIALGSARTFTVADDGTSATDLTISGVISGSYGITKAGAGTMTLSGANTYTGTTSINVGILQLGGAGGTTNTPLGTTGGSTTVASGAALDLNGFTLGTSEALTLNGTGANGGGALMNSSITGVAYKGVITFNTDASIVGGSGAIAITGTPTTGTTGITLGGAVGGSVSTVIAGARTITKTDAGTWILSGANTYTGTTTINAGILQLGGAGGATNTPLGTMGGSTMVASGAALDLNGFTLGTSEPLTLNGTGVDGGGALINSSTIPVNYNGAITLNSASSIGTTGNITLGSSGISGVQDLTKVGTGTLSLGSGTVTLGALTISAGSLTSTSGTMNLTGSLTNNATFTHNSGTVKFNGTSAQTIGGTSSTTFNSLTISNSSGVALGNSQIVNGTLTLTSGRLTLGVYNLTLGSASPAVAGSPSVSNMIVADGAGLLLKGFTANGSYVFPIGDATGTAEYSPITLNFVSGAYSNGYAGVRVTNAKHPNNASATNYLNRYWTVSSTGITSFSCTITGTYLPADVVGSPASQVAGEYSGSLPWKKYSTLSSNILTAAGVTSFGDFTGITAASPTVSIAANPSLTVGQNSALTLTANPVGDPTFTYSWSPGGITTQTFSPSTSTAGSTAYTVTVTDGNGFTATSTATVVVYAVPIQVSATSGTSSGNYSYLKDAFDKINDGTHKGTITIKINQSTIESSTATLYQTGYNSTSSYTSVNIYPTVSGLSISRSNDGALINLSGAGNVTIDGRVNATGSAADLVLISTCANSGASTLQFTQSAQNNTVKYCTIKGSSQNLGVVTFYASATGESNSNNMVTQCNITGTGTTSASRACNAVYSYGAAGINTNNTISNNNIYDVFKLQDGTFSGINIDSYSGNYTITGNSFYETATSALSFNNGPSFYAIRINTGDNYMVSNNYIGGRASQCGSPGSSLLMGTSSNPAASYCPIYLNVGTGNTSVVQGNVIKNITLLSSNSMPFSAINIVGGAVNVLGNTIGASSGVISISSNNSSATFYGINVTSIATETISGNTICSLTNAASSATGSIIGISLGSTGIYTVSQNFINNLSFATAAGGSVYGYQGVLGTTALSNNIISLGGTTATTVYGIYDAGAASQTSNMYFNTVYIGGSLSTGVINKSYALYCAASADTRDIRNNIFDNARSTTSGSSLHYAAYFAATGGTLNLDFNDYITSGTGGVLGYYNGGNKTSLPFVTGLDTYSSNADPSFTLAGGTIASNYSPGVNIVGASGTGVTADFGNVARTSPTIGAWEAGSNITQVKVYDNAIYRVSYSTLKAAFDKINDGTWTGALALKIAGNTTETASAVLNASGSGSASYTKIDIYPISPNVSITGSISGPLVSLNGADNVTINGSVYEINGSASLTLSNTSATTNATTLNFVGSAQNNSIKYCNIYGIGTGTSLGVVTFSTATVGTGNDNDTISYCNISGLNPTLTNRPVNAVYSAGSSSTIDNSGDVIINNNIYNFLNPSVASNGINIGANSNAFIISGNSFYETSTFVPTSSVEYAIIRVNNPSGGGFTISNNYIGGNASSCSGAWTKTSGADNVFEGIYLNTGSTTNSIQGNVISGFSYSNSANASWTGIYIAGGVANIGTVIGNTIGANTGTGSVTITESTTGGNVYGIYIPGTSTVDCENNTIGSITTATGSNLSANFYGIYKDAGAGTITISNNLIGSNTTLNSINTSSAATLQPQILYGVYSAGTGNTIISGNTIANLTNSTTGTSISPTRGIFTITGSNTIQNNTIHDIATYNAQSNNYQNATLIGIEQISATNGTTQIVSGNNIYNLENTSSTTIEMYGIYYEGPSTGVSTNIISRNFIHSFIIASTDGAYIHGLSLYTGAYTVSNNVVFLGDNITSGCHIWGIWNYSNYAVAFYHNTVYLNGVAATGTSNSFAFRDLSATPSARDIRNNIFWNGRVNTAAISHYAIYLQATSNTTLDYNDYQFAQNFCMLNTTSYATLASWQSSGYGLDLHSISIDPQLTNLGGSSASDYQPGIGTLSGASGTGITTDYGYLTRSTTVPTMGAWEYFGNPVEIWKNNAFQQAYPTLKAAFDAINAATWTGDLTIKIKGNTKETASAVLYQSGYTSGSTTSSYSHVLIYPTRSLIQVKGRLTVPLIDLNGADNVTFDGRLNGTDAAQQLLLINDSVSSTNSTVRFINTAENNTIQYCNIKGASTATTGGIVYFATASSGNGNSGNKISNNSITSTLPTKREVNAVYSAGTASFPNSKDTITGNSIYDFLSPSSNSYGINISSNSTDFAIIGNSFYETTTFTPTTANTYNAINIDNTSGNNFTVSGNYIGGQAAQCLGPSLSIGTTGISLALNPVYVNVGTTTPSLIQGNTIQNISFQSSSATPFSAINVNAGNVNVTGNTIGSLTGTGSLLLTSAATTANSYGIYLNSSGAVSVLNNTIGSIMTANSNSSNGHSFYGIYKTSTAGALAINGNIIGNATSNNINASSTSSSYNQSVYGIYTLGTGGTTISANTIANILNSSTMDNAANSVFGIVFGGSTIGPNAISGNFIYGLNSSSAGVSNQLVGIGLNSGVVTVANNIVSIGDGTSGLYNIYGIYDAGSASSQVNSIYHNTAYLSGTISSGTTSSTAAFYKASNTGTSNILNNVFFNARSGGSTGEHYAIYLPGTNQTINYNDYYVNGTNGVLGYLSGDKTTLALWQSATSQDINSLFVNPTFKNAGSVVATDYLIGTNLFGTSGTGITTDYGLYPRSNATPSMGAWEWYNKWKGSTSIDWNTASNWTSGVVPSTDDNIVFDDVPLLPCYLDQDRSVTDIVNAQSTYRMFVNGKQLQIKGDLNFTNGAQIDATANGSTVKFAGSVAQSIPSGAFYSDVVYNLIVNNANNVTLNGNLRLLNTLVAPSGLLDASTNSPTFCYGGSAAQTIENSQFLNNSIYNLTIDNASGVTLNTGLTVGNALTVNSGKLFTISPAEGLTVNGLLTNNAGASGLVLASTAAGTASLVHYSDGVQATVNRFIPSDSTAWYFLSTPVATQSIFNTAWTPSGTHGAGTGYDLYVWDEPSSCWIYNLNDSTGTNITYTTWPQAHPESYFVPGRGYLYALMGADATKQFIGSLNNGTISRALTASASGSYTGFNLLGNPYPSSIDWTNSAGFGRSKLALDGSGYDIWIWSQTANNYGVYNSADADGTGTNNVTQYIAPMQGFFVLASSAGSFTFNNNARTNNSASAWLRSADASSGQNVRLSVASGNSGGRDEVKLGFGNDTDTGGALKIFSPVHTAPSLYLPISGSNYTTCRMTSASAHPSVPVSFKAGLDDTYTLTCRYDASTIGPLYLEDRKTEILYDLSSDSTYTFRAFTGDAAQRFVLHFGTLSPINDEILANVWVKDGRLFVNLDGLDGAFDVQLVDMKGSTVWQKTLAGGEQSSFPLSVRGAYVVTVKNGTKKQHIKVVY